MRRQLLLERIRRLLPWAQLPALVILAGITLLAVLDQRRQLRDAAAAEREDWLQDSIGMWEDRLVATLEQAAALAADDPEHASLYQVQLQTRQPWFDRLYLWTTPRRVTIRGHQRTLPADFVFPVTPPTERTQHLQYRPCLARAQILAMAAPTDVARVADAYVQGCASDSPAVRVRGADEAAALLLRAGRLDEALDALDASGIERTTRIRDALLLGVDPARLVTHRLLLADVLTGLGDEAEATRSLIDLAVDATDQDAPVAALVLERIDSRVLPTVRMRTGEGEAARIEEALRGAERRQRAWREISERILPYAEPDGPSRFIYDQYTDPPFLLYQGPASGSGYGVALQLDQEALLLDFLSSLRRTRRWVRIADAQGRRVAGTGLDSPVAVRLPFTRTLTHLRVELVEEALDARVDALNRGWGTLIILVLVSLLFGGASFFSQRQATRHQRELLQRQREFATRVTHELKTPLAGIRVMAENIEFGAWSDTHDLASMARRVVSEADRLTARVNEILAVTRERTVPDPVEVDLEEPLFESIDQWGPRLEQEGVRLQAELGPADPVLGDPEALRDAVGCLLDNALKYRRPDRHDPSVWLELRQEGRWAVIEVADNGLGVPPKMRRAIFDRFVRVEGPNRGTAGGHGLGLAQVAGTARAHGGTIECASGVDGGARFVLRLPIRRPSEG